MRITDTKFVNRMTRQLPLVRYTLRTPWVRGFFAVLLPEKLALRSDLHLLRKIFHMSMGLLIVAIFSIFELSARSAGLILGSLFVLSLILESIRLRNGDFNQSVVKLFGGIMRSSELNQPSGIPYYLLSTSLAVMLFPKAIAILSILYLACGDPAASFVGLLFGQAGPFIRQGRSWAGTLAGIAVCFVITFGFLAEQSIPSGQVLVLSFWGGLAGGLADLLPVETDDNFTIPIVSGFALWLGFIFLGVS